MHSNDAVDQSSQNSMAVILKVLDDTFVEVTKASETRTTTFAVIKEDTFLCPKSDEEEEKKVRLKREQYTTKYFRHF